MDEESCWRAVLARDVSSEGEFVYAVRSTGVYCRPSCPSRRPSREGVVFFPQPEDAEMAGFRPCRRCRPRDATPREQQLRLVEQVCGHIDGHPGKRLSLSDLGALAAVSPYHLQRIFKRVMGITPRQYAEMRRLGLLKERLRDGDEVTSALYEVGYGSSSRLYERVPGQMGMTPGAYRRGGQGMRIAYNIVDSVLGRLLVAATERGICAASLGDADAELEAALLREYPAAEICFDETSIERVTSHILRYLNGQQHHLDLPLDLRATAFQWKVWEQLRTIPYGSTRSYGKIAQSIGRSYAGRAVGQACGANPVALVIPCHRAVREDGSIGGYRWGVERKRSILAMERTADGPPGPAPNGPRNPVGR